MSNVNSGALLLDVREEREQRRPAAATAGQVKTNFRSPAAAILDRVWGMRHTRGDWGGRATTLGTCRNQACLHEQQAL